MTAAGPETNEFPDISNLDMRALLIISTQKHLIDSQCERVCSGSHLVPCPRTLDWILGGSPCFSSRRLNHRRLIGDLSPCDLLETDCTTGRGRDSKKKRKK
ncbi:hypothetical protein EYF80_003545 [Liparis tanakae]|uniref:Uncharacterized protein n=1 Tax=Liparis tanakae TaxID=230148 RepID=A0A4Z2J8V0_9TELE|nr:hypothetical protein EYF80_003545 [Liparis tanakae]